MKHLTRVLLILGLLDGVCRALFCRPGKPSSPPKIPKFTTMKQAFAIRPPRPRPTDLSAEILLYPNPHSQYQKNFGWFVLIVFLPLLICYLILLSFSSIEMLPRLITTLSAFFFFLGIYFIKLDQLSPLMEMRLRWKNRELVLFKEGRVPVSWKHDELSVSLIGWGTDACGLLPALRIRVKDLETFTVGAPESQVVWKDVGRSVPATDYLTATKEEWQLLLDVLAYHRTMGRS